MSYNCHINYVSSERLAVHQGSVPYLIIFVFLITCLSKSFVTLSGEIIFWSLSELNVFKCRSVKFGQEVRYTKIKITSSETKISVSLFCRNRSSTVYGKHNLGRGTYFHLKGSYKTMHGVPSLRDPVLTLERRATKVLHKELGVNVFWRRILLFPAIHSIDRLVVHSAGRSIDNRSVNH